MPSTTDVSANQKSAYQRPYKTRNERREIARRKHDENADRKFLTRAALVVGAIILIAIGIALKGSADVNNTATSATEARH